MRSRRFDMHKLKLSLVTIFVFWVTSGVFNVPSVMAQHEGHTAPPKPATTPAPKPAATPAPKPAARPAQPTPARTPAQDHTGHEAQPTTTPTPTPSHVHDTTATPSTEESLLVMSEDEMGITVVITRTTFYQWGSSLPERRDNQLRRA